MLVYYAVSTSTQFSIYWEYIASCRYRLHDK